MTGRIRNTLDYVFYWMDNFSGLQKCDLDICIVSQISQISQIKNTISLLILYPVMVE